MRRLTTTIISTALLLTTGPFATAAELPAQAAQATVHGVDVSGNDNSGTKTIDWDTVAAHENFAFIKATEGSGYTSQYFKQAWPQMKRVGIPRAPYHFLLPVKDGSVAAQANHFVAAAKAAGYSGTAAGELPPVLDLEWDYRDGSCPAGITNAGVKSFVDTLRSAFHRDPIIYTNKNFLSGCGFTASQFAGSTLLWIADYSASSAPVPPGWPTWTFWQYTSKATVPGIPKPADRNWFNGSLASLRHLAGLGGGTTRDVTGNGWDDVVARNRSDGDLYVYDGYAPAKLAAPKKLGTGWGGITTVLTGEFTGDAYADLLGITTAGDLNLYAGTGQGTFAAPRRLGTGWSGLHSVVTADFTGDGHGDLIGVQTATGDLYLYASNDNGSFAPPRKIGSGWGGQTAVLAGDFDHDGHGDLVGRASNGDLNVYTGHGDGAFNAPRRIGTGWSGITALIPGDFTHDGYTDVLGRTEDGTLSLYPGSAAGLGTPQALGTGWNGLDLFQS